MAEKKTTPDDGDQKKTTEPEETVKAPMGRSTGRGGAGEYVVIADQIILPNEGGKRHTTHRFGARVSVNAEQARRLVGGTRPVLVEADKVKDTSRGALAAALRGEIAKAAKERTKRRGGGK